MYVYYFCRGKKVAPMDSVAKRVALTRSEGAAGGMGFRLPFGRKAPKHATLTHSKRARLRAAK